MIPMAFQALGHPQGLFQWLPVCGSILLVPPDALGHFLIQSLSRGQIGFRAGKLLGELLGKMALPTPRPTGYKNYLFIHKSFSPLNLLVAALPRRVLCGQLQ
jgi:hypothetical protein